MYVYSMALLQYVVDIVWNDEREISMHRVVADWSTEVVVRDRLEVLDVLGRKSTFLCSIYNCV